jgi:hypothetical protein
VNSQPLTPFYLHGQTAVREGEVVVEKEEELRE